MALIDVLKFIVRHPLNEGRKVDAVLRFARWQIGSRLLREPVVHEWIAGSRFLVRHGETGLTGNLYAGLHEFADMAFVMHALRPTDLFVDIGANAGSYTILACAVAKARGCAFEPLPSTYRRLTDNVRLNGLEDRVRCLNMAVGSEPREARFTTELDTVNHIVGSGEATAGAISVPVTTLDAALGADAPWLMKIDVEGYELPVLEGATATLRQHTLHAVILELNGSGERYGHDEGRIVSMMADHGFEPCSYDPFARELLNADGPSQTGNTIFVRHRALVSKRLKDAPQVPVNGRPV
jgi:FkbM family methyltransferase